LGRKELLRGLGIRQIDPPRAHSYKRLGRVPIHHTAIHLTPEMAIVSTFAHNLLIPLCNEGMEPLSLTLQ